MSENEPENRPTPPTPAPSPSTPQRQVQQAQQPQPTEQKSDEPAYAVFEKGDENVSGKGDLSPDMYVHAWNNGYKVLQVNKDGSWKTSLRDTE